MSAEHGPTSPNANLLAALADPAVEVDGDGRIRAWNAAAAERFPLDGSSVGADPDALLHRWQGGARRVNLAGTDSALIVWSLDEDGLGPDEVAISRGEVVGRTSGSALHEINNALNLGIGLGGLIAMEPGVPADLLGMARDLEAHGQKAQSLAHAFLEFSRTRARRSVHIKVGPLLQETVSVLGHTTISMEHRVSAPSSLPEITGDDSILRHAIFALLVNALEAQGVSWEPGASPKPGRLVVSASERNDAQGHRIRIAIDDGAPPVPDAERAALFTGHGSRSNRDLVVARHLVRSLGGRLAHEPIAGGNRIVAELPVAGAALADPAPASTPSRRVVLVCDSDLLVRNMIVRMLERKAFAVLEGRSAAEGIDIASRTPLSLVIADWRLPDMSCAAFYDQLTAVQPSLASALILLSGDASDAALMDLVARSGVPILHKPFDSATIDRLIREVLGA